MPNSPYFHTKTSLSSALTVLLRELENRLALGMPLKMYLAGGMAVHLYTSSRVTTDIDAEFGGRVIVPRDLIVPVRLEDGSRSALYIDTNYNSTFALMHEDYQDDALPVDLGVEKIKTYVLSPVDLAVSKIARFDGIDREDIKALVGLGLTTADEIEQRANAAVCGYVGGLAMLRFNIRDAVALARDAEVIAKLNETQQESNNHENRGMDLGD